MGVIWEMLAFRQRRRANVLPLLLTAGSLAMIGFGFGYTHQVRTIDSDELEEMLGFATYEEIEDFQLIIDSTFTGVASKTGNLYSTYDRGVPDQKRPCPT